MKNAKEILFSHYDKDPEGGLLISDEAILAAMEEYAREVSVEFLAWYIQGKPSKFEVKKVINDFMKSEYYKELQNK